MIETTALFFAFAAIPYGLDLLDPAPWRAAVWCALFGTLASLQKVTTGAPVLLLRLPHTREAVIVVCAFGVPLLAAAAWTRYTDIVKSANPFAITQTSAAIRGLEFWDVASAAAVVNLCQGRLVWNDRPQYREFRGFGLCPGAGSVREGGSAKNLSALWREC